MPINKEVYEALKREYNEVVNLVDKEYSNQLTSYLSYLYFLIPMILAVIVMGIFEHYFLSSFIGSAALIILIINSIGLIISKKEWKKERDRIQVVFQMKILYEIIKEVKKRNENSENNC